MQRCDADVEDGIDGELGPGAVSRPGPPEGAPIRAADAASRDGQGGARPARRGPA